VVRERGPVVTLGELVELDPVILDGSRADLLSYALANVANRLPDLEQTQVPSSWIE